MSHGSNPPPRKSHSSIVLFLRNPFTPIGPLRTVSPSTVDCLVLSGFAHCPLSATTDTATAHYCKSRPACGICAGPHAITNCRWSPVSMCRSAATSHPSAHCAQDPTGLHLASVPLVLMSSRAVFRGTTNLAGTATGRAKYHNGLSPSCCQYNIPLMSSALLRLFP
ncbi:hypothetical protein BD413DRAFT_255197 [Trametes elegans]|nr:hypothetical protein BD413DRAFT_255197 [Trametes elegans]